MKSFISKTVAFFLMTLLAATMLSGCSYAGLTTVGNKVVVARNDGFLFGALRKVYVCKVTDTGLTDCSSASNP